MSELIGNFEFDRMEIHTTIDEQGRCRYTLHWTDSHGKPVERDFFANPTWTMGRCRFVINHAQGHA